MSFTRKNFYPGTAIPVRSLSITGTFTLKEKFT